MYVTRPLSHYQKSPESLFIPPEGPNSGILVLQDEESESYCCFGQCKKRELEGDDGAIIVHLDPVLFIPVLVHPLSSNCYYAIKPNGKHKGEAFTCSTKEDNTTCWRCVKDAKPKPLDPHNIYQQFEILYHVSSCSCKGSFVAKSIAPDGFPPIFLRRPGWKIEAKTPKNYKLEEALGLNLSLRACLPELNLPPSSTSSEAVVIGKWYCPFVFIKDGTLKDQMERSVFYEMTLEQRWEQIFTCQNDRNEDNTTVQVDTVVEREEVLISGKKAKWDERKVENGVVWFKRFDAETEETSVGLKQEIVEQMKWEQERGGWSGGEKELKVKRREVYGNFGGWREFGSYILVERFVLKRIMDGSLVMTYSFKHSDKIKSIWV